VPEVTGEGACIVISVDGVGGPKLTRMGRAGSRGS